MKNANTTRLNQLAWLFVGVYVAAMFVPRVVIEGMFADGLCYSAISRNLAQGKGSMWLPYFSSSFWIAGVSGSTYYENMPMLFWLQAPFFIIFGDYWWVEKLFCAVLVLATALLLRSTWRVCCDEPSQKDYAWLAQFWLYTVPIVLWAYPFNQLDTLMAFFTLLSVHWGIVAIKTHTPKWWILTGIGCFGAFLAKGPVGIFPLVMPLLAWGVFKTPSFKQSVFNSAVVSGSFVGCFALLCSYEPARSYIAHFLDQQLLSALAGKREGGDDPFNRLYIFQQILQQNAPMLALVGVICLFARKKVKRPTTNWVKFFVLLGLAGSVPIGISPKQHELYLIPAMFYFALAAAWFVQPVVQHWFENTHLSPSRLITFRWLSYAIWAGVMVYAYTEIRKPGRETQVLADMPKLAKYIPLGEVVGVCEGMMDDFVVHCYLQRYYHWELSNTPNQTSYCLSQADCSEDFTQALTAQGFKPISLPTQRFRLWMLPSADASTSTK